MLKLISPIFDFVLAENFYTDGIVLTDIFEISSFKKYLLAALMLVGLIHLVVRKTNLLNLQLFPRVVLIALVVMQIYALSLMEYNHFFDAWFVTDRILIAILGVLTLAFPSLIPFFATALVVFTQQLGHPDIIGYDHTHKSLVLPLLLIIWLCHLAPKSLSKRWGHLPAYLILSLMAIWYIQAGWGKYRMGWPLQNNLYNLYAAAVDVGWMHSFAQDTKITLGEFISDNRILLQIGCVITELLLPFVLVFRRWIALLAMAALTLFHLGVYLASGIFFWQWIILETLILVVWAFYSKSLRNFWGWKPSLLFLAFIGFNLLFHRVTTLAWYDSGYLNTFTYILDDGRGNTKALNPTFFAPYDVGFAKNRFYFSRNERPVSATLGNSKNLKLIAILDRYREGKYGEGSAPSESYTRSKSDTRNESDTRRESDTLEIEDNALNFQKELQAFRDEYGWEVSSPEKTAEYETFIRTFTANKLDYDPKAISNISPFIHMQSGPNQQNLEPPQRRPFRKLHIIYTEKIALPQLRFKTFYRDTLTLNLGS
ncbi:MAG: hypothetical protein WA913_11120 [Pricia sp.]